MYSQWHAATCISGMQQHVSVACSNMYQWHAATCISGMQQHVSVACSNMYQWHAATCMYSTAGHYITWFRPWQPADAMQMPAKMHTFIIINYSISQLSQGYSMRSMCNMPEGNEVSWQQAIIAHIFTHCVEQAENYKIVKAYHKTQF